MKGSSILSILVFISTLAQGQLVVGDGATLSVNNILSTNGSVYNDGSLVWGANSLLFLNGEGELLTAEGSTINNLKINGVYHLRNSINVANSLTLLGGTLTPIDNTQLLLLNDATIASDNGAYIAGILYHQGTGTKFYPIGKNGTYTPVILSEISGNSDVVVGLEAFNQSLGVEAPQGISEVSENWYWKFDSDDVFEGALVTLPIIAADENNSEFSILQAGNNNTVIDLGADPTNDFSALMSRLPTTGPYVLLGFGFEEDSPLTIHNIITPGREDGKNDVLYIENIDRYKDNTVILMDRWGTEVCRMKNFSNDLATQQGCDIKRLPAGNYICVVAYAGKKFTPVLITILK